MKQSVIDQMKEYQSKRKIVKAIQYREGMEDGWIILLPDMPDGNDFIKKVFNSKDEAKQYTTTPAFCNHEYGVFNIIPVMLTILADDEVEICSDVVTGDKGFKYEFTEINEDSWLVVDDEGNVDIEYSTESFDATYELHSSYGVSNIVTEIGFDKDLLELFVELNHKRILLDRSEVATVEKILEGLEIPYTEKLGELLLWDE